MISVELCGGLGNVMFQIAFIQSLGKQYGLDAGYANTQVHIDRLCLLRRSPHARDYLTIFKNIDWWHVNTRIKQHVRIPLKYTPVKPVDGVNYLGCFASERNFYSREFVLNLFEPADWVKGILEAYPDVLKLDTEPGAIHVRRTDYVGNDGFTQVGMDYYQRAMAAAGCERYLVCSDDEQWCRQHFVGDQFIFMHDKDYIEMFLMSRCPVVITTNSTYSWWSAYLNTLSNCRIYTPLYWFPPRVGHTDDVVPKHWIRI